jgi:hypothetical protein
MTTLNKINYALTAIALPVPFIVPGGSEALAFPAGVLLGVALGFSLCQIIIDRQAK